MSDGNSLVNLGDLTKPATVLIEKISDAIGVVYRPRQIKRIAQAEAEAEKIKTLANIEISDIQQRALVRHIVEETKKQENIESITAQALTELKEAANPQDIENDWLTKFFNECKLVSDGEMQSLWAKLLAGEANRPGTFSKRTLDAVSNLDKNDAQLFTSLCSFVWSSGNFLPIIYDTEHEIYKRKGIDFIALTHLDAIGLIRFDPSAGFASQVPPAEYVAIAYYGTQITINVQNPETDRVNIGKVILTKLGQELAPVCGSGKSDGFIEYIISKWQELGYITSCPLPHAQN